MGNYTNCEMRINLFTSALLAASCSAINIASNEDGYPVTTYRKPPLNAFIHSFYCEWYGEDPNWPACAKLDKNDFRRYSELFPEKFESPTTSDSPAEEDEEEDEDEPALDEEESDNNGSAPATGGQDEDQVHKDHKGDP